MSYLLQVTDNGDGSGGMATISGSGGADNTLWAAPWKGVMGVPINLTVVTTMVGDGQIDIPSTYQGFYLWFVTNNFNQFTNLIFRSLTSVPAIVAYGPDAEACAAIISNWNADTALVSLVPGGLHKDKLVAPAAIPYAEIQSKSQKQPLFCGGGRIIDYREITLTVWGIGDVNVGGIVPVVIALLRQPLCFTNPRAKWLRNEELDVTCTESDETKSGQEYRAAVFRFSVWTDRD
jgi:hypothetical protein